MPAPDGKVEREAVPVGHAVALFFAEGQDVNAARQFRTGHIAERKRQRSDLGLKRGRDFLCCWVGMMGRQDRLDLLLRAIGHVVRQLGRTDCQFVLIGDGDVPHDVRDRFIALWKVRLAAARETAPNNELAAFGWWFGSKKLDPEWAGAQAAEAFGGDVELAAEGAVYEL